MPDLLSPATWVNGLPQTSLPVSDRGVAYGDGVFETIRISSGHPTLAELHWQRLVKSCKALGIVVDLDLLMSEVAEFLSEYQVRRGVLKVIVTRGSGGRGYNPAGCLNSSRCLSMHPLPHRSPDPAQAGARVKACRFRLGQSMLAGMKHLNRLEQVMACAEWQSEGWDEGLVCDFDGHLIEGTMSNLFMITTDGRLITPELSHCGVAGVCREYIMNNVDQFDLELEAGRYRFERLDIAEMFLCNSVNGVWPVVEFSGQHWQPGVVTTRIRDCVLEELNG